MKVTATKGFDPVLLTIKLESQAEVDALYSIGNFSVTIENTLREKGSWSGKCKLQPIAKTCQAFYEPLKQFITKE